MAYKHSLSQADQGDKRYVCLVLTIDNATPQNKLCGGIPVCSEDPKKQKTQLQHSYVAEKLTRGMEQ